MTAPSRKLPGAWPRAVALALVAVALGAVAVASPRESRAGPAPHAAG